MNKKKKRTVEEIYKEFLEKYGGVPINLSHMLDPDIDYHCRTMAGVNEDLLGPIDKKKKINEKVKEKKLMDNIEFVVPEGPWNHEDDYEVDFYDGIMYFLDRKDLGNWTGYVRIPEDHPWYKSETYDDVPVEVHGGLTYAKNKPSMWSLRNEEDIKKLELNDGKNWLWIGFDCAHYRDIVPYREALEKSLRENLKKTTPHWNKKWEENNKQMKEFRDKFYKEHGQFETYKDINFARKECFSMIDQMKNHGEGQ